MPISVIVGNELVADWDGVLITTVETHFVCGLTICPELAAFAAVREQAASRRLYD